jgi:hypothetical protein
LIILSFVAIAINPCPISAAVPETVAIQGTLEAPGGGPLLGTFAYRIGFYDTEIGGVELGVVTGTVTTSASGRFALAVEFPASALDADNAWYELAVDTGGDGFQGTDFFADRARAHSVPFALKAGDSDGLGGQPASNFVQTDSLGDQAWSLSGNSGAAAPFLGTTDDATLEFRANNQPVLRIIPNPIAPNLVGGSPENRVGPSVYGGTIGGGGPPPGEPDLPNTANSRFGTIGGGFANRTGSPAGDPSFGSVVVGGGRNNAIGDYAVVAGGFVNNATGSSSFVGGGDQNEAEQDYAFIGGGVNNRAGFTATVAGGSGNTTGSYGTVGGGNGNTVGDYGFVGGGIGNRADDYGTICGGYQNQATHHATVSGGYLNSATRDFSAIAGGRENGATGEYATVSGGRKNLAEVEYSTVSGGYQNRAGGSSSNVGGGFANSASGGAATVAGGNTNSASGSYSTIAGGVQNKASGESSVVAGGYFNSASGDFSTIPGGDGNVASGNWSFAAGRRAHAEGDGSFVFADSNNFNFEYANENYFAVRCTGGATFVTGIDGGGVPTSGVFINSGGNAWSTKCDRESKTNYENVDSNEILHRLDAVPIQTWNLKSQDPSIRHIGPVAQDFHAAFGVGEDNLHIGTVDADGVALAAIQGLHQKVKRQETLLARQQAEIDELKSQIRILTKGSVEP